jgi:hypothetical protein
VPDDAIRRDAAIRVRQYRQQRAQCFVLRGFVGGIVGAFALDSDRVIVAGLAALPGGSARVPRALVEGNELHRLTIAADQHVRGHAQSLQGFEEGVHVGRHARGEESRDPRPAIYAGRQTDSMHDDEIGFDARGARVEVRRQHLFDAHQQAGTDIDAHARTSRPSCHTCVRQ